MHASKYRVGTGLKGKMRVPREARSGELPYHGDEVVLPVHGLNRTQAEARQGCTLKDRADKTRKICCWRAIELPAPAPEIDSRENQFLAVGLYKLPDLIEHGSQRQATGRTSRLGDDTEGATVRTALLNLKIGACLTAERDRRLIEKGVGECVIHQNERLASRREQCGDGDDL